MNGDTDILRGAARLLRSEAKQDSYRADPKGWAEDVLGVHLWSKQAEVSRSVRDNKRTVVASCHGTGKALALDTPLPTPTGWTTMGEVQPGDELIAVDGTPTKVVAVSPVWKVGTYRVTFSNGEVITASGDHEWFVLDKKTRNRLVMRAHRNGEKVDWRGAQAWSETRVLTTRELAAEGVRAVGANREYNFAVPAAGELEGIETAFAEDLYAMGTRATVLPFETWRQVVRASVPQRREFAQGVADAFGYCHKGVMWLVLSELPVSVFVCDLFTSLGEVVGDVSFDAEGRVLVPVRTRTNYFRDNAAEQENWQEHREAMKRAPRLDLRMIVDVTEVPIVETKCVQVDHPMHGYLAGRSMVPTHNSMIASVIACWWVAVHPPGQAIVITTAPTYHQVNAILWEEMRKHHRTAKARGNPLPGYITQDNQWKLADGALVGMGRKPADGDAHAFQGIHRPYVLVLVDEACGVPEELWTGVEAITTTNNSRILAIGNPDDRDTTFGDVYLDERYSDMWNRIHIPASSTPNFTGEPVPDPLPDVLVQRDWVAERARAWGTDDPRYQSKVEANFPEQSALGMFSAAVRAKAFDSEDEPKTGPLVLGVDPARYGDDRTAVVAKRGRLCWVVDSWMGMDTVSSASRVLNLASELRERDADGVPVETGIEIRVDAIGLGAGVVDTLASWQADLAAKGQAWFRVREMNGAAAAPVEQGGVVATYGNARAFWYDHARQDMANGVVKIVPFDVLDDELSGVRFKYSSGKLYIESKDDMRKRGVKSPDFADAFVYAAAHIFDGPSDGDVVSEEAEDIAAQALFAEYEERLDTMISPF